MRSLVVLAAVLVAGACGARVDGQQVSAERASSPASADELAPGPGDTDAIGTSTTLASGRAVTPGAGTSTGGAATAEPDEATAPGDNGGATDVGVTPTSITFGNVSTLSGPVPGLFEGAVVGAQAVIAYQNSRGGLFGRFLKLDARDDQFDTGQNRAQTIDLITKTFAFLGSFSLYDDAAVAQIQASGIPDVSYSLSKARREMPNNFSVQPAIDGGAATTGFIWFKQHFPEAVTKVGSIYGDVPASKASQMAYQRAAESVGWHWVYERGIQPTETDFTADVIRMRQAGVKTVYLISTDDKTTARIAKAMTQQGWKPDLFIANYMPTLWPLAGSAAEGVYTQSSFALYGGEDAGAVPEVALMQRWLNKVKPGAASNSFAVDAWASGRLLFQAMEAAGPKATRADVLKALRAIDNFSANDLLAPAGPASKRPPICMLIAQLRAGKYVRVDPMHGFLCNGTYHRS